MKAKIGDVVRITDKADMGSNPHWCRDAGQLVRVVRSRQHYKKPCFFCNELEHAEVRAADDTRPVIESDEPSSEKEKEQIHLHEYEYELIEPERPKGESWLDYIRRR